MFSIKSKLILAYTLVFGLMLTIFAAIIYESTEQASFLRLNTNLKSYALSLRTEIEDELEDHDSLDIKRLRSIRAKGLIGEHFQLLDRSGNIIVNDSVLSRISTANAHRLPQETFEIERQTIAHQKYHIVRNTFETENDSVYILETAASVKDVFDELDRLLYLFFVIIPAGLLLTGVAAHLISKAAFKPITHMTETAKKISGKNLDRRLVLPRAHDEVRALGETLNEMIERLDKAFRSQKRFIADASHELRTPLTVIQTELEILERKLRNRATKESIRNTLSEIESLTKLTSALLTLSKLDGSPSMLNLAPVRIDELLTECVQLMNAAASKKNVRLTVHIADAVEMNADKEKLKSVFVNLIDNAVKFSSGGSPVSIRLERLNSGKIRITVKDNGCGIPEHEMPHIFERFFRSNETRAT
ncbi:MAG: HAMP domain-containing histidine kinase, partial [Bacteroidota bacterium]|nr:HAMP domain-containing histidine kinase [Bacteroidota bacterium]